MIEIAQALDAKDAPRAWRLLQDQPLFDRTEIERRLLRSMVRRALAELARNRAPDRQRAQKALAFLDQATLALERDDHWQVYPLMERCEAAVGAEWLGFLLALCLADRLGRMPPEIVGECLARVFATGRHGLIKDAWHQALRDAPQFVPDFWQYQSLCRTLSEAGHKDPGGHVQEMLQAAGAGRLQPLAAVYDLILKQAEMPRAMRLAAALAEPEHRRKIAVWTLGASQAADVMPLAVELHDAVAGPEDVADRAFMQARLAVAQGRWADVIGLTGPLVETGPLRHPALCLQALALAHLGRHAEARHALEHILRGGHAPWFLTGRAQLIALTNRLLQDAQPLPNTVAAPALVPGQGRPLAQSLWVGPRLRWIERLSMQSYLANGWRYQLHVFDLPENVPDGVELMDAAAILPRDALFREGAGSGMHRGSVGAFSDLFRYALLARRGGMWTDTDVINLDRFEPEGRRFVSTEVSDAGIIGTNGAMMAAPAGCALQRQALRRAQDLLTAGNLQFARIGPVLLAELFATDGLQGYTLLPTPFLNPVGWMETGALLEPFATFAARPVLAEARNIHVYTETWRLIGLGLDQPPQDGSFLGRLAAMLEDPPKDQPPVRELLAR